MNFSYKFLLQDRLDETLRAIERIRTRPGGKPRFPEWIFRKHPLVHILYEEADHLAGLLLGLRRVT